MGLWCATCSKYLQNNIQEMMEKRNILTCWIGFRYKLKPRKLIVCKDVIKVAIKMVKCSSLIKQRRKLNFIEAFKLFSDTETSSQPPWSLWLAISCRWLWRTNVFGLNDIVHILFEGAILRTILTWLKWKTEGKAFFFHCRLQDWLSPQCSKRCCYATWVALFEVLAFSRVLCCAVFRFGK